MTPNQPHLPETPWEALGPLVRETVFVDDQTFLLERPAASDQIIDDPAIRDAFAADEYLPYWADLWPAARMLARIVWREPWTRGLTALELGCGLGLPGVVALARGLRVLFNDCDRTALRFAERNARLNGLTGFEVLPFDWRFPPEHLQVPVVLASDLAYERRHVEPVVELLTKILAPGGLCLLTDQDRPPAAYLRELLMMHGFVFTTQPMRAGEPGGRRYQGTLYRITHAAIGNQ